MGAAMQVVRQGFDDFASAASMLRQMPIRQGTRRGRGVRKTPRGRPGWIAPYNDELSARRAIRRAERWLRANPGLDLRKAPTHIQRNAQNASAQFRQA